MIVGDIAYEAFFTLGALWFGAELIGKLLSASRK